MSAKDPDSWMWERARALLDQADRMHLQVFQRSGRRRRPAWVPPADVFETAREVWIVVALPGVAEARVEIAADGARVSISGERRVAASFRAASVKRMEIPLGRFERALELPVPCSAIARERLSAGLLFVALRKRA
ncbi:MAG: Hsp20/alpha crystallin family protein [Planctomycetes bacterium]|nr:Hsp20/alpha crystallin family protein [Planctomycetota bacterium]